MRTPAEAVELVSVLLEYTPSLRVSPLQACAHAFFDELRDPLHRLPNGRSLPPLFNFTQLGTEYLYFVKKFKLLFCSKYYFNFY